MRVAGWEGEAFYKLEVNCIVLAGGKSVRLGRNKLVEKVGGHSLLERVVDRLSCFNSEIIVVTALDSALPNLDGYPKIQIVNDIIPGKGSLGGLYSGLTVSNRPYNLVVACDMPFLNVDLFNHLIGLVDNYDAVIPLVNDKAEPLHAVYSRSCLPAIKDLIEQNRLSILGLFPFIKVRYVNTGDIERFDPQHLSFFNVNTEVDLRAGREIAGQEDNT
jgi:molybdopterin-guanine dinucleotide biosynthesis protein A